MERVPRLPPNTLDAQQRQLYEAIVGGPRARQASVLPVIDAQGSLEGPFGPLLHAPHLGAAVQQLGAVIRSGLRTSDRAREIATLWCAAVSCSRYEIEAHRRLGLGAGLTVEEVQSLVAGVLPATISDRERAFAQAAAREVWSDDDFADASSVLTSGEIVEATVLGGYYRLLANLLSAFGIDEVQGGA